MFYEEVGNSSTVQPNGLEYDRDIVRDGEKSNVYAVAHKM
jgi:hypothetical protein